LSDIAKAIDAIEVIVDKEHQKETELEKRAKKIAFEVIKNEEAWEGNQFKEKPPEPQRKDTSNQSE
jgi:hypothetical protein